MRWLYLSATFLMFTGCGDVEWFPENTTVTTPAGSAAAPTAFTFPDKTVVEAVADQRIPSASDIVTVQGNNPAGWTVSFADTTPDADSEVIINGVTFIEGAQRILPNQTLQIRHVPSPVVGASSITTVTVGTFTTQFRTVTVP